jgi:RHS repeat-associated protein
MLGRTASHGWVALIKRTALIAVMLSASLAQAHDFGGPTDSGGDDPPDPGPPCNSCPCSGPPGGGDHGGGGFGGGSGSGGGGGGSGGPGDGGGGGWGWSHRSGNSTPNPFARDGKPVSFFNGAEELTATDLVVPGVMPILIQRKYDSRSNYDSPLGFGWAFLHDRRLYEYPDNSVVVRHGCGTRDRYVSTGGGYATPVGSMLATLAAQPDGTFQLSYLNGAIDIFDSQGRLVSSRDSRGNSHEYTYDARGKLPLVGSSKESIAPTQPMTVAQNFRLTRVDERGANGALTGNYVTFEYDESTGRLTSITSDDGRTVTYQHDVSGSLTLGNLAQVNGLEGVVASYAYADPLDPHNLTSITSATGRTPIVNTYDAQDRVIAQEEGTRRMDIAYPVAYVRTTVTKTIRDQDGLNPYTSAATYEFDTTGRVIKIVDALGHERRYTYNSAKLLARKEIWQKDGTALTLAQAVNWSYDSDGSKRTESVLLDSGEGITRSWTYDHGWIASEQVTSSAEPAKIFRAEYTFYYGVDGRPTNVQSEKRRRDDGSFQTTTYSYDSRNRLVTTTLPDGVQTVNEYTGDYLTRTYFVVGGSAIPQLERRFEYNEKGELIKQWDARDNLTEYGFDDRGRMNARTDALGEQLVLEYADDNLVQVERGRTSAQGEGQISRFVYDNRGLLSRVEEKNQAGVFVTRKAFALDSEGRRLNVTDALGRVISVTYDVRGLVKSHATEVGTTYFAYDALGNLVRVTDAAGGVIEYAYDDLRRRTEIRDLRSSPTAKTTFTYDAVGNVTSITDAKQHTTIYEYDALSRNTRIVQPLGQFVQYTYTVRDQLKSVINARGQEVEFNYFGWGGKQSEGHYPNVASTTPSRLIGFQYDEDGNMVEIADSALPVTPGYVMEFDAVGRLSRQRVRYIPGGERSFDYRYDRFGNRGGATLTDGTAYQSDLTYDRFNQIASATFGGSTIGILSDAGGARSVVTYPNEVSTTYQYRQHGEIENISIEGPAGPLADLTFDYDERGNMTQRSDSIGVHTYQYDDLGRLEAALRPAASGMPNESFGYDAVGNRLSEGGVALHVYDQNNRLVSTGGQSIGWDADSNLVAASNGATLSYDARNRLSGFTSSSNSATYLQDSTGRRIRKTVNGVDTWFLWDGLQLIAEYDHAGARLRRYDYLGRDYSPIAFQDGADRFYVHTDHIGAAAMITNEEGMVVWSMQQRAFGAGVVDEDPDGDGIDVIFNMRLPGQYADAESGYHYNMMRTYDPGTGRYLQADPLGQVAGFNVFTYALNAPQSWIDPEGLHIKCSEINGRKCPEQDINRNNVKDGAPRREWGEIITTDLPGVPVFAVFKGELFWSGTLYTTTLSVDWTDWQTWTTVVYKKITCPPLSPCGKEETYFVDCEENRWDAIAGSGTHRDQTTRFEPSPSTWPTPPVDPPDGGPPRRPQPRRR